MNLYVLNSVVPHLSALSKLFQTGDLNFAQIKPAIELCKSEIMAVIEESIVWKRIEQDWQRYREELGELTTEYKNRTESLASR